MTLYVHEPITVVGLYRNEQEIIEGVPLSRVTEVVDVHDVLVRELIDEQLVELAEDPAAADDPHWMPVHSGFSPELRAVALASARRLSRSLQEHLETPEGPDYAPWFRLVRDALAAAQATVTWRVDLGERGERVGGCLILPDGVVLHDDIDGHAGQHVLVFRSQERELAHLMGMLDPDAPKRRPAPAADAAAAVAVPTVTDRATSTSRMTRAPLWRSTSPERVVSTISTDDGCWVSEEQGGVPTRVRRVGEEELDALARGLLRTD